MGLAGAGATAGASGKCGDWPSGRNDSFLKRPGWREFRRVLVALREFCPPAKPVVVRTSWLPPDVLGECRRTASRFVIRLNNRLRQDQAVETLLHEWAHGLAWNYALDQLARMPRITPAEFDRASHDEAWGCAYSRVWRVYSGLGVGSLW
jgi:hypothetical protein